MKKKRGCFTQKQKKELACNSSVLKDSDDLNIAGEELIYHCLFPAVSSSLSPDYCDISDDNSCDITRSMLF